MSKKTKIAIVLVAVLALLAAAVIGYLHYQNEKVYNATYIVIDGVEYERAVTSLDFSGTGITELDKLKELTTLQSLDLRGTGISIEQYKDLQAALPACSIFWSVPFQGTYYDSDIMVLDITALSGTDVDVISCFSRLKAIRATGCTDYDALAALMERYPHINVTYTVEFSGEQYVSYTDTLNIVNPDLDEIRSKIGYMPKVTTVYLTGTMPAKEDLLALKEDYPEITFGYDFEVFGIAVNSLDDFIDLSGIQFGSTEEVEAILPYFYNLQQVDMVNCGFSNDTMDALNKRYRDVKFVWTVNVCGLTLRTDARYFMPVKYKVKSANASQCVNLKYCTDMEVIDLGHYGTSNVDFVEHMPNLKYLLLCDAYITDLTAIGNCISLEYLELFQSRVTDFWPLTNLTNLRDLNLAGVPCFIKEWSREYGTFGDYTPLLQMTWLDRLWLQYNNLNKATREELQEALPNTMMVFQHSSHTGGGFRFTPRYFEQRDIIGMYYGAA